MRFKSLLLGAAAAALCSTGALADSGPTWTGLYLGVQVGVNSNTSHLGCVFVEEDKSCADGPFASREDSSLTSTLAGGYAGYNYRFDSSNFVIGVEGDFNAAFGKQEFSFSEEFDIPAIDDGYEISSSFYGSIRGRAGVLLRENFLAFVTAGWAFENYKLSNPGCSDCSEWDSTNFISGSRSGLVIGGGVEYALDESIHLKLQYLHSDFGKKTRIFQISEYAFPSTLNSDQVDLGISWGFGG